MKKRLLIVIGVFFLFVLLTATPVLAAGDCVPGTSKTNQYPEADRNGDGWACGYNLPSGGFILLDNNVGGQP